jgi:hypothetical protein
MKPTGRVLLTAPSWEVAQSILEGGSNFNLKTKQHFWTVNNSYPKDKYVTFMDPLAQENLASTLIVEDIEWPGKKIALANFKKLRDTQLKKKEKDPSVTVVTRLHIPSLREDADTFVKQTVLSQMDIEEGASVLNFALSVETKGSPLNDLRTRLIISFLGAQKVKDMAIVGQALYFYGMSPKPGTSIRSVYCAETQGQPWLGCNNYRDVGCNTFRFTGYNAHACGKASLRQIALVSIRTKAREPALLLTAHDVNTL